MNYGWTTLKRLIWLHPRFNAAPSVIETITGVSPLILVGARKKPLQSLTQYGKTEQANIPAPDAPQNIYCNNGTLRMVDDELPNGYKRLVGFRCNNNVFWEITGFKLKGSDTVRISFSVDAACNVFGCYQGTDANDNYDIYASTSSGAKYLRYANGTYLSYWSNANLGQRFDVVITPTGTQGMPQDSTWSPASFTSANDMLIGTTAITSTSAKFKGCFYGNIEVDGRLKLIPCVHNNSYGYYDTYTGTFYGTYPGYGQVASLGYDPSHYVFTTDGAPEIIRLGGNNLNGGTISHTCYTNSGEVITSDNLAGTLYKIPVRAGEYVTVYMTGFDDVDHLPIDTFRVNQWSPEGAWKGQSTYHSIPYAVLVPAGVGYINIAIYSINGVTIGDNALIQVDAGTEATIPPTRYAGVQTATAGDLLATSDNYDTQDIISGTITRNIGYYIFTGRETFGKSSAYGAAFYVTSAASTWKANKSNAVKCTHFQGLAAQSSGSAADNTCFFNASGHFYFRVSDNSDAAAFKAWVEEQYDMGTPIVVMFSKATPTTESVAPQALTPNVGDNILSWSTMVRNKQMTAVYKKTPNIVGSAIVGTATAG